ncbi:MAG: tRNA lysidine(34) synthetase TilS [Phycisphaerales bacterium]|nr:tRNA lysidine(34) synthetase TilS [Phycisphaerales bacterium]
MPLQPMDVRAVQRDAGARAVLRRWRQLTGGSHTRDPDRRTLVACSGGADSTALLLALAGAQPLVAHVVHDLRDPAETAAERDRVAALAAALGLGFIETSVAVRALPGNAEANARRARYRALAALASRTSCPFVATAHHAGDQLETMLMAMLRGAGVGGLAGMPATRALGRRGVILVRPMLAVGRADAERLCTLAGVTWATDPTNADISRFRAALRHGPLRALEAMRPGGAARAAELAEHLREVGDLLRTLADAVVRDAAPTRQGLRWDRSRLAAEPRVVAGTALRLAYAGLHAGRFADRLPARSVREVLDAIGDGRGGERRFVWKASEVFVRAGEVELRRGVP